MTPEKIEEIRSRSTELLEKQSEYHRRLEAGESLADKELLEKWPQLQKDALSLRQSIQELNQLGLESPARPGVEADLIKALQPIGLYLEDATHPSFSPRVLDEEDVAEMQRIEHAIASMEFGDRSKAYPTTLLGPSPLFTLIHLPTPLVIQSRPHDTLYLASTTGGAFANGLSLIELKADDQGLAKTTWMSIGDAVANCELAIYSQAAIEPRYFQIKVVSPVLKVPDGLPRHEPLESVVPRLESKAVDAKGKVKSATD